MEDLLISNDEVRQVLTGLRKTSKDLPASILYDKKGSQIYEEITKVEEYYLFAAELSLLKENADRIAKAIAPGSLVVELGCGTACKTAHILNAIQSHHDRLQYVGIDVSETVLQEAKENLLRRVKGLSSTNVYLVQGEYLDGLKQVRQRFPDEMLSIMWLGSSVGNFTYDGAILFFRKLLEAVGSRSRMFLSTDMWKDENTLHAAYFDRNRVTERFIKNGMKNALSAIGHEVAEEEEDSWIYRVQINQHLRRVEMYLSFPQGLNIEKPKVFIRRGESILVEFSRKFIMEDIQELAAKSGFCVQEAWRNKIYGCQMLLPGSEALRCCWDDTDELFGRIRDWSAKPIDVRHPFFFYYGHLIAFARLKLIPAQASLEYDDMFSRGIDPLVLDPSKCHCHPEIPDKWPSTESIVNYVQNGRFAIKKAVEEGKVSTRLLCFALEHERMHQETLAYMLTQQTKITFEKKNAIFKGIERNGVSFENFRNSTLIKPVLKPNVSIPAGKVKFGAKRVDGVFLWDNEQPICTTSVSDPFLLSPKPVTIGEYMFFVLEGGYDRKDLWLPEDFTFFQKNGFKWPATWTILPESGDCYVHHPFSTKHWSEVADEPVYVSLSEAQAFCNWVGCRIMTEAEYHRALDYDPDGQKLLNMRDKGWEWTSTAFNPFPGFQPQPEYEEYSTDFFDGKHFVLKGSSPATHPSMYRDTFRNFYQRQYLYVFAKFRRCCM
eukprot:c43427_g1_i1 orf=292-2445(+)